MLNERNIASRACAGDQLRVDLDAGRAWFLPAGGSSGDEERVKWSCVEVLVALKVVEPVGSSGAGELYVFKRTPGSQS